MQPVWDNFDFAWGQADPAAAAELGRDHEDVSAPAPPLAIEDVAASETPFSPGSASPASHRGAAGDGDESVTTTQPEQAPEEGADDTLGDEVGFFILQHKLYTLGPVGGTLDFKVINAQPF